MDANFNALSCMTPDIGCDRPANEPRDAGADCPLETIKHSQPRERRRGYQALYARSDPLPRMRGSLDRPISTSRGDLFGRGRFEIPQQPIEGLLILVVLLVMGRI